MYLVDSCTIVSAFRPAESAFEESRQLIFSLPRFCVTDHVLAEVGTILKFRVNTRVSKQALDLLCHNEAVSLLRLSAEELENTIDFFISQKRLSFVDASLVVMARERGLALITQDKALLKAFKNY